MHLLPAEPRDSQEAGRIEDLAKRAQESGFAIRMGGSERASPCLVAASECLTSRHTATLLPDGRVLLVGGSEGAGGDALASAEVWEPSDG